MLQRGGDLRFERGEAPFEVEESDRVGRVGRSRRTAAIESSDPGKGFVIRSGLCCRGRRERVAVPVGMTAGLYGVNVDLREGVYRYGPVTKCNTFLYYSVYTAQHMYVYGTAGWSHLISCRGPLGFGKHVARRKVSKGGARSASGGIVIRSRM